MPLDRPKLNDGSSEVHWRGYPEKAVAQKVSNSAVFNVSSGRLCACDDFRNRLRLRPDSQVENSSKGTELQAIGRDTEHDLGEDVWDPHRVTVSTEHSAREEHT